MKESEELPSLIQADGFGSEKRPSSPLVGTVRARLGSTTLTFSVIR